MIHQSRRPRPARRRRPNGARPTRIAVSQHPGRQTKPCPADIPEWEEGSPYASLKPELQHALKDLNFSRPTPVQAQCLQPLLEGKDLLATAQTGTGKTAAFVLPMLERLAQQTGRWKPKSARVLILAPTRELAIQIQKSIGDLGAYLKIKDAAVYGGVGQRPQEKAMQGGVDFLVATPGRLLDLMQQGHIELGLVEVLVLDEADRMLDMGFINDIRKIVRHLPTRRQTLFFSATMPAEIKALSKEWLQEPVKVEIAPEKPTVDAIDQKVFFVDDKKKHSLLLAVLQDASASKVILFTQMKHVANKLAEKLNKSGIGSSAIHGNKSQAARIKALEQFRNGKVRVLVATDIAARGIDVDGISHVINYQIPSEPETYVHRIGRTARAGQSGHALSFCSQGERKHLHGIERLLKKPIPMEEDHAYHCPLAAAPMRRPNRDQGSGKSRSSSQGKARPRRTSWRRR